MHVTEIQISNPTYRQTLGEFSAVVNLVGEARDVQLLCNVPAENENRKEGRRLALIRDALRQFSRMPEIRTGREKVSFAPGVLPSEG